MMCGEIWIWYHSLADRCGGTERVGERELEGLDAEGDSRLGGRCCTPEEGRSGEV